MNTENTVSCRICKSNNVKRIFDFGRQPIAHRFLIKPSGKEYTHPLTVSVCENCSFTFIDDPIPPELLYQEYFCLSSWKNHPHIPRILDLISQLDDVNKDSRIIEIGSNDGSFLKELYGRGYHRLTGVEPSQDSFEQAQKNSYLKTFNSYFNKKTAEEIVSKRGRFDLLIARHVLEHIFDLEGFGESIRLAVRPGGYVFIEVPNFEMSITNSDYSAVWEEEPNCFTLVNIERYLGAHGIRILHSEVATFSGEALMILGKMEGVEIEAERNEKEVLVLDKIHKYADAFVSFRDEFAHYLSAFVEEGKRLAFYGAGCRANSIINFLNLEPYIVCMVDDQEEKQGKYMPGSHLPVRSSEALVNEAIDIAFLSVNAENDKKVENRQTEFIKNGGKFVSVLPPSRNLPPFWNDYCL